MTQGGWIKLSRKMLDWRWYQDSNTMRLFVHLLLKANIEVSHYKTTTVHRGELVTSCAQLASELSLSERNIRTALAHLKATGEVSVKWHSKFIVISIENYSAYQGSRQATEESTAEATEESSVRQPRRQVQNLPYYKELKNKEGEKAAAAATPILPREEQWVLGYDPNNDDDDDDQ